MSRADIIISTYNRAHAVRSAIESALAQTYGDVQVTVVDDGLTDGTADIVASFGSRVRYLWQENSGSPSDPRNRGFRTSDCEFIAFLRLR